MPDAPENQPAAALLDAWRHEGWESQEDDGFLGLLGPLWERHDGTGWRLRLLAEPKHRNRRGMIHGGVLMAFADRAMSMAVRGTEAGRSQATVQLDVHFLDGVSVGEVVEAACRLERETRTLAFVDGTLSVGTRAVATAKGIWKIIRPHPPAAFA